MKQAPFEMCIDKKILWDVHSEKAQRIDRKVAEMLVLDDIPFSHVEDLGFRRLMNETVSQYSLRKKLFYRDIICEKMYDSVKTKASDLISSFKKTAKLTFTSDEWSDTTSGV